MPALTAAPTFPSLYKDCAMRQADLLHATTAAAAAATTAAIAAAAEQNHEQNDNPAASTIIFETHNTRLLCVSFI